MSRDDSYLRDIVYCAGLAARYVEGHTIDSFLASQMTQDAVVYRLSLIGEAARALSEDVRVAMPDVPWRRIVTMRNHLVHRYWNVDEQVVWDSVHEDLPKLVKRIEAYRA